MAFFIARPCGQRAAKSVQFKSQPPMIGVPSHRDDDDGRKQKYFTD
jgi:hypothetical protein